MAVYEKWNTIKYGTVTVGKDDTGHDVKFFGATSGSYWLWDESADAMVLVASDIAIAQGQKLYLDGDGGGEYIYASAADTLDINFTTTLYLRIGGTQEIRLSANLFAPYASDGCALGNATYMWSDLFLASEAVINFNAGNVTITHAAGALACTGALTLSIATASTSTTTGGLIVTGGVGIGGALFVGTTGNFAGQLNADATTASTTTASGALVCDGGAGIAGALFVGSTGNFAAQLNADATTASSSVTTGALVCDGGLGVAGATYIGGLANIVGVLTVANATEATTTAAAALVVTGGIGFGGDMYVGDDVFLTSGAVLNWAAGGVTITHAANKLSFAGATAAGINGYSFDMAVGAIASEAHGIDITATGTLASGKSLVGLNVKATAAGTAGAWLSGLFVNATQASKMVNGYLCAAEFELTSTAANASDNSVIVLNSARNHTGSPPAADPYIMLREYGATYANVFVRVFGDTGQGDTTTFDVAKLVTEVQDTYEVNCRCAIRCMVGSTPMWLMGSTTAPTS